MSRKKVNGVRSLRTWPREPNRLPHHVLSEIAKASAAGEAFLANTPQAWQVAFGLVLGQLHDMPDHFADNVGAVWEWTSKAKGMTELGVPWFASVQFIHKADMPLLNSIMEDVYSDLQEQARDQQEGG